MTREFRCDTNIDALLPSEPSTRSLALSYLLTTGDCDGEIEPTLKAGASAYVLKRVTLQGDSRSI